MVCLGHRNTGMHLPVVEQTSSWCHYHLFSPGGLRIAICFVDGSVRFEDVQRSNGEHSDIYPPNLAIGLLLDA